MSRTEAIAFALSCDEDEGPESYDEAAELFAAMYGRRPDDSDGDQHELWSHVCAAIQPDRRT